jgi:hypothetical protein
MGDFKLRARPVKRKRLDTVVQWIFLAMNHHRCCVSVVWYGNRETKTEAVKIRKKEAVETQG